MTQRADLLRSKIYYDIEAFNNGKIIGRIEFDESDGRVVLFGMSVDSSFRRAEVCTLMMHAAAELHGKRFGKPSFSAVGSKDATNNSYCTQEGAALIRYWIQKGILDDTESFEEEHDDWFE